MKANPEIRFRTFGSGPEKSCLFLFLIAENPSRADFSFSFGRARVH
jgi:hypothetical protein